jgi:hypothetical protein
VPKDGQLFYICYEYLIIYVSTQSGFGGLGLSVLAFGTQVREFNPGRSQRIFKGEKILSFTSPPSEGK